MFAATLLLAVLPTVLADPRSGPSDWVFVAAGQTPPVAARGYLVQLPAGGPDQAWLERVVELAATGAAVVSIGPELPPPAARPYVDGVAIEPAPPLSEVAGLLAKLEGVPLVLPVADPAGAVDALANGASSVLVSRAGPGWAAELVELLPEFEPATGPAGALPTALRGGDLATIVGLPKAFAGTVRLPGAWYGEVFLVAEEKARLPWRLQEQAAWVTVPPLPGGGVLVATRPVDPHATVAEVRVQGKRIPSAAEVLARHQRQVARQNRLLSRWMAEQTLLLRVEVAELGRSFAVVLAGPVYWEKLRGSDWEIARAWVDGVAWRADRLPDLPLLEAQRPPVPPLALRLEPAYHYELKGLSRQGEGACWELRYVARAGEQRREGTACVDAVTWGLARVEEVATNLPGEVRATHSVTTYEPFALGSEVVWLPIRSECDDTVAAFGGTALVRRELTLSTIQLEPEGFEEGRERAYRGPNRMLRDSGTGVLPLVPDGRGGRQVGGQARAPQRFVLAGVAWDPGLVTPVPFGGLQLFEFDFRKRGEQLRLFLAGVVNDGAWTLRSKGSEFTLRAFTQLVPLASTIAVRGKQQERETLESTRQRLAIGWGHTFGRLRLGLEAGAERWDFKRSNDTAREFVLPSDTWEWIGRCEGSVPVGAANFSLVAERGWRQRWRSWGLGAAEEADRVWTRARAAVLYEKAMNPLARLRLEGEYWAGWGVDRFSAPSPGRFGSVRLRGIPTGAVVAERLGVVRTTLGVPLSSTLRGEVGVDAGWVRDERSGFHQRPLSGLGVAATLPGPWETLVQASLGVPLAAPGRRQPTLEVFILRHM